MTYEQDLKSLYLADFKLWSAKLQAKETPFFGLNVPTDPNQRSEFLQILTDSGMVYTFDNPNDPDYLTVGYELPNYVV